MKLLVCLLLSVLLPAMLAADLKSIKCPDGTVCEGGKTCTLSELTEVFECQDMSPEELQNKKMISGLLSYLTNTIVTDNEVCENGTLCDDSKCCPALKKAVCCENLDQCCPEKSHCCGNTTTWCCPQKTKCHENYGYCVAGASMLLPATACLVFIALLLMTKNFI